MNVNNQARDGLIENGLALEVVTPDGRRVAFERAPHPFASEEFTPESQYKTDPKARKFADTDPSTSKIPDLTAANRVLTEKVAAINADTHLSETGKREAISAAATETMRNGVASTYLALVEVGARLRAEQAALFAVPKSESDLWDIELCKNFKGLSEAERSRLLSSLDQPQHERMLHALLRSPEPLDPHTSVYAQTAWAKVVGLRKPAEAQRLGRALANHEWSLNFATFMAQRIARACWPVGDSRGFDHQAAWNALRSVKATKALQLDAHQEIVLEHRAVAAETARAAKSAA
jgi:hypothetical protein